MADSRLQLRPNLSTSQRRQMPKMPLLVQASISLNGQTFRTLIHEGASVEQLIEKVAKENGGGVAKVYYPEFKTYEIVAVKVGNQLLVKNDPKRVAEADFSDFNDSASVKRDAVSTASSSTGGIHFFVGKDGIPMAAAEDNGIVFPNGEELRINSNIRNLSLSAVEFNVDPRSLSDLDGLYKNGTVLSMSAKEEIEQSHGGVRSEKLMLPDSSVLILGRESGQIKTAAEFAGNIAAEGFAYQTQFQLLSNVIAEQVKVGLSIPTDLGTMNIPFDGSNSRIPYSHIKLFDGKVTGAIKVNYPSFDGCGEFSEQQPSLQKEESIQTTPDQISNCVQNNSPALPSPQIQQVHTSLKTPTAPLIIPKIPKTILPITASPLPEPIKKELPNQPNQKPISSTQAKIKSPKSTQQQVSKKQQRTIKTRAAKSAKRLMSSPITNQKKKLRAKKSKCKIHKPATKKPKIASSRIKKHSSKTQKPGSIKPSLKPKILPKKSVKLGKTKLKSAPKIKVKSAKKIISKTKIKKELQTSRKKQILLKKTAKIQSKIKQAKNRKKKKIQNYYFNTMIGLYMPKRGRTRAGSSVQRKSVPRT